ncbi:MAG: TRAP transporter TatT component family protein [Planctomycetota bacterium]|jgi:tetratricopeptide (TPR) repeat protein
MGRTVRIALGLLVCASAVLATGAAGKLITRGDKYYGNRGKGVKWVEKSIECYEKALAVDTKSVEASWKLARASHFLGSKKQSAAEKMKIFQKGIDAAKRAITLDEKSVESHYWLGVCYGKFGAAKGIMNSLGLVPHVKKEMDRVIELDKNYAHGGAYVVLGRMYYKLPGIAGGSNEKSLEFLDKAVGIDKGHLLARLYRAETYLALDKKPEATKELEFVISAPTQRDRGPENADEKRQAKELLATITKEGEGKAK